MYVRLAPGLLATDRSPRSIMAGIKVGNRWGFIDKNGKVVVTPSFDDVRRFSLGLAPVQVGNAWGYIDKAGKYVWNPSL